MKRFARKKKKKVLFEKKHILGIFITLIMVFSGAGLFFGGNQSGVTATYNDIGFKYANGVFVANIDGIQRQFYYLPDEVQQYNTSNLLLLKLNATRQIDVTSDFDSPAAEDIAQAQYYLQKIMADEGKYVRMGFLSPTPYNNTIITCDEATQFVPVLVYEYSNITAIEEVGNCVYIKAGSTDQFSRITHNIIYRILGVI